MKGNEIDIEKSVMIKMSSEDEQFDDDEGIKVEEAKPKLKQPPLYQVVLINDDFTPMEFVVGILEHYFAMNHEQATQVMIQVHEKGKGICGVFTRDIAETKVYQVNEYARENQHPLLCDLEEA